MIRRALAPALGIALCAALLAPGADRDARVALAFGHLLSNDFEAAFGPRAAPDDPAGSFFRALDARVGSRDEPALAVGFRVDGAPPSDRGFARALGAQLNRYSATRRAGRPPLRHVEGAAPQLVFELASKDEHVGARAVWSDGASVALAGGGRRGLPGRAALVPPLLAIAVALALRRVLIALLGGIWVGAVVVALQRGDTPWLAWATGLRDVVTVYFANELFDTFRVEIIGFVVALVAMIGVMTRAGGAQGLVERLLRFARTVRSALFVTWGMGILIFFDDYANCMLVGSTMRPLTDRLRISREKLAYVVDSTAAPIAGISVLSTWIAFEVSVFSPQLPLVGITQNGYAVFLQALPFRYYCLFTLVFVAATIASGRDFGPMARAERRARLHGQLVREGGRPPVSERLSTLQPASWMPADWRLAAAPIGLTLAVTLARIFVDGGGLEVWRLAPETLWTLSGLTPILLAGGGAAPIFAGACAGLWAVAFLAGSRALRVALVAGALAAALVSDPIAAWLAGGLGERLARYPAVAIAFALGCAVTALVRIRPGPRAHLSAAEIARAGGSGAGALGFAVSLLFCAWMIGAVCRDLATADYLVALLSGALPPVLLPLLLFSVACAVSFATGSSWSTMAILLPNVVGLAAALGADTPLGVFGMVTISIAAVLDGSIFGDHCSPISDTTVLSSVSSGSDHIDHVRTQAPYALLTALFAVVCGYLPAVLAPGWSLAWALAAAAAATGAVLWAIGSRADAEPAA